MRVVRVAFGFQKIRIKLVIIFVRIMFGAFLQKYVESVAYTLRE